MDTGAMKARADISRMFEAAEAKRDYPGSYFPALMKAQAALKAWQQQYPEAAEEERAAREAKRAAEEARRQRNFENSFIGRGLD